MRGDQLVGHRVRVGRLRTSASRTRNSSPPWRLTVSASRTAATRRSATRLSTRSPKAWPSVSLSCLKLSRSRNSSASAAVAAPGAGDGLREAVEQQRRGWAGCVSGSSQRGLRGASPAPARRCRPRPGWRSAASTSCSLASTSCASLAVLEPALGHAPRPAAGAPAAPASASTCSPRRASLSSACGHGVALGSASGRSRACVACVRRLRRRRATAGAGGPVGRLARRPAAEQAFLVGQHVADVDAVVVDAVLAQFVRNGRWRAP